MSTSLAALTAADRQRIVRRLDELRALDALLRETGRQRPADRPLPEPKEPHD